MASLYEENVSPHLVVAPLSTLRNWEREFATWAPHMNVVSYKILEIINLFVLVEFITSVYLCILPLQVMYVGTAAARAVIREFEFYFPRSQKKDKKKKHGSGESKQERIKFDVLLTSYEMINIDNGSLKAIDWETMVPSSFDFAHSYAIYMFFC